MPAPIGRYSYGLIPGNRSSKSGGDDYDGVAPTYKQDQVGGAQGPSSQYDPSTGRNTTPPPPKDDNGMGGTPPPMPSASGSPNDFGQAQSFDHGFTNFQALVNANRQAILGPGSGYAPPTDPMQSMTGGMSMLDSALNNIYQRNTAMPTGKKWNGTAWEGQDAPAPTPLPGQGGYVAPPPPVTHRAPPPRFGGDDATPAAPAAPAPAPQQPAPAAPSAPPSPSSPAQGSVPPTVQGASPADRPTPGSKYKFLGDY